LSASIRGRNEEDRDVIDLEHSATREGRVLNAPQGHLEARGLDPVNNKER
jgi:hypothetical protein